MTIAGPPMLRGMRYCTYIWLTVIVPGTEGPTAGVPGWVDVVVSPLTKKLPSSCSSKGPPSDPPIAVPPVASSSDKRASKVRQSPAMRVMDGLPLGGQSILGADE